MEELASNLTISVIMSYCYCHEMEYLRRKSQNSLFVTEALRHKK